ncbi:uncharacterized protein LOC114665187 isoform X2 [Erpetoichthys calabaricus]|uniref:uncharacterized protein LOC114665187 isoform X2 n=1 Tax=Erpetoichthys calabaricus TaxID=27687 RepID=UPI0010A00D3A|nr:uncharacterized protein LOC114665187 isoform X2 [Erpetoichthys calabaricus]
MWHGKADTGRQDAQHSAMSQEEPADLVFEGFLKKRKDKMKMTWMTYWFRLHNCTLFFYTKKNGDASHLRGQYYVYTIQSVREVKTEHNEFLFEIVMKNGKRKLLSAETEQLRSVWMEFLWKAMQLPGPGHNQSGCTWHDIPKLKERALIGTQVSTLQDTVEFGVCLPCHPGQASDLNATDEDQYPSEEANLYDVPKSVLKATLPGPAVDCHNLYDVPRNLHFEAPLENLDTEMPLLEDIKSSLSSSNVDWINSKMKNS